ncbi:MAG: cytochrome c-type biogenesis protein [Gammaproteobacteria bacterium]
MKTLKLKLTKILAILLMGSGFSVAHAAVDIYPFTSPQQAMIFKQLTQELRCLVCQNQNLADSNAPLANDLRREIYRLVNQGVAKKQIITYVVSRYGDFVLFKPKVTPMTYLIWFGPFVLLILSLLSLIILIRRRQQATLPLTLSAEERIRLQTLLARKEYLGN